MPLCVAGIKDSASLSTFMISMLSHADICQWLDGSEFMGERLVVQFARGGQRPRDDYGHAPRMAPRPRRTVHRMTITGLPPETSWQVSNSFPIPSWL